MRLAPVFFTNLVCSSVTLRESSVNMTKVGGGGGGGKEDIETRSLKF